MTVHCFDPKRGLGISVGDDDDEMTFYKKILNLFAWETRLNSAFVHAVCVVLSVCVFPVAHSIFSFHSVPFHCCCPRDIFIASRPLQFTILAMKHSLHIMDDDGCYCMLFDTYIDLIIVCVSCIVSTH